jgi:hypothetical protein
MAATSGWSTATVAPWAVALSGVNSRPPGATDASNEPHSAQAYRPGAAGEPHSGQTTVFVAMTTSLGQPADIRRPDLQAATWIVG